MAYATGSASGCAAVLQALATFAAAQGWTVDNNAAYSGGWWLAVHKGACYLDFVTPSSGADNYITIYGATGFSVGAGPSGQAQTSTGLQFTAASTPYAAYHFFSSSSGTYLHCLIEISSGTFVHFHGGLLNAVGGSSPDIYISTNRWYAYGPTYSGDTIPNTSDYYYNTAPFSGGSYQYNPFSVLCTVDGTTRWFQSANGAALSRITAFGAMSGANPWPGWNLSGMHATPNRANGLAVLYPLPVFAERAAGSIFSLIGEVPDVRNVNMENNNAKDEITIGTDVWKLFPMLANIPVANTNSGVPNGPASSYPYGLAFKKNA